MEGERPVIEIHLGISKSCVGVWRDDHVEILANQYGNRTMPSWVAFNDTYHIVGEDAKNLAVWHPASSIYDVQMLIGRRFSDRILQNNIKNMGWPFIVRSGSDDNPVIVASYMGEEKQFSPEEISSMVLVKMKKRAEAYLCTEVKDAVITVPAYFNYAHRQATIEAGTMAGLNVMYIMSEPIAAAIAYKCIMALDFNVAERNILVFYLGVRTLDVYVVVFGSNSSYKVISVGGANLGGVDFDNRMVDHFVCEFNRRHNKDIKHNPRALERLRAQCKQVKISLSSCTDTAILLKCLYEDIDFSSTLSRDQFENMNLSLFKKCVESVKTCLREGNMNKGDVNDVVLVGGSTQIPKVRQLLQEFFDGKELCKSLNPDEVVAYGAAVHAANLSGVRQSQHEVSRMLSNNDSEIDRMVKDAKKLNLANEEQQKLVKAMQKFVSDTLDQNKIKSDDKQKVEDTIEYTTMSFDWNVDLNNARNLEHKLKELQEYDFKDTNRVEETNEYKMNDMEPLRLRKARLDLEKFVSNVTVNLSNYYKIKSEDKKKLKDVIKQTNQWLDLNVLSDDAHKFENKLKELQDICNHLLDVSGTCKKSSFFFFSFPEDGESSLNVQDQKYEQPQQVEKETIKWLNWMLA